MTIAKNGYMHERLSACLHTDSYVRFYIGICHGWLGANTGTVDIPIKREDGPSVRRVIDPCGAEAITDFRLLKDYGFNGCRGFAAEENEQAENIVIKKKTMLKDMKTKAGLFLSNSDFARGGHIKYEFMRRPSGTRLQAIGSTERRSRSLSGGRHCIHTGWSLFTRCAEKNSA